MKTVKQIISGAVLLFALWFFWPTITAARPQADQVQPISPARQDAQPLYIAPSSPAQSDPRVDTSDDPKYAYWPIPDGDSCQLWIPPQASGRVPYAFPPRCNIVQGMPTRPEPQPDPTRQAMSKNVVTGTIDQEPIPQPQQQPTAAAIVPMATRDWTNELTAVNRNLENAVEIVEDCARQKVQAASQFRVLDCTATINNLEQAKQAVYDLQETISDSNR